MEQVEKNENKKKTNFFTFLYFSVGQVEIFLENPTEEIMVFSVKKKNTIMTRTIEWLTLCKKIERTTKTNEKKKVVKYAIPIFL
jgi:hypothetical protein